MLSRKPVNRSGRGFRGYFPSDKLSKLVEFESMHEWDAIKVYENSKEVVSYQEQPTIIYYHNEFHQPKKYYPDFELVLTSGQIVHIEVKPHAILIQREIAKKYSAIYRHYLSRAEHFAILTERDLKLADSQDIYQLINNDNIKLILEASK